MGNCCSGRRKNEEPYNTDRNTNFLTYNTNNYYLIDNFQTENINDTTLKETFYQACKQENILVLLAFYKNNSILTFDENTYVDLDKLWMAIPETLSDLAAYKIHSIVSDKIGYLKTNPDKLDKFVNQLMDIEFVDKLIAVIKTNNNNNNSLPQVNNLLLNDEGFLNSNFQNNINSLSNNGFKSTSYRNKSKKCNNCKLDYAILTLAKVSNFPKVVEKMFDKESNFDFFLEYLIDIQTNNYIKRKQHTIVTFELIRNIYVVNIKFRERFINNKGLDILVEFMDESNDFDILQEVVYSLQDLIYVNRFI